MMQKIRLKIPHPAPHNLHIQDKLGLSDTLPFDPELLFVECQRCERPLMWEQGKTTEMLRESGVDLFSLDEHCLILSDGCPHCSPRDRHSFLLTIVRIAELSQTEAELLSHPVGSA